MEILNPEKSNVQKQKYTCMIINCCKMNRKNHILVYTIDRANFMLEYFTIDTSFNVPLKNQNVLRTPYLFFIHHYLFPYEQFHLGLFTGFL